ncbi:MAG: nucleotidyltransferase domain-containing protein [Deltaproteobacteria bacterium]
MRLPQSQASFLKQGLLKLEPTSEVYLFGSRALTSERGGDIDILWLTPSKVPQSRLRALRVAFFQEFGWQKLDIVNFCFSEEAPFKQIALQQAVRL